MLSIAFLFGEKNQYKKEEKNTLATLYYRAKVKTYSIATQLKKKLKKKTQVTQVSG